jgi:hypothetical protein
MTRGTRAGSGIALAVLILGWIGLGRLLGVMGLLVGGAMVWAIRCDQYIRGVLAAKGLPHSGVSTATGSEARASLCTHRFQNPSEIQMPS